MVDDIMFSTSAWSIVYANNAKTGEMIWKYDPKVPKEKAYFVCCDVVNRGVAVWQGKVFLGTIDGRLIALDAKTGEMLPIAIKMDKNAIITRIFLCTNFHLLYL